LVFAPELVPVTLAEKVHEAPAARVAAERLMLPLPAVAVMVPPPHEPLRPFGVLTTRPAGRVSVKATPVSCAPALGLVIVNDSDVLPPIAIDAVPNDLLIVDGL